MAIVVPIIAKFIDDGLEDAKRGFKEAETTTDKLKSALESAAGPAKAMTAAMLGAGFAVAKNAGGAVKANNKLKASFAAVGYEKNAQAAIDYADSLQHVIGVSDEEIQATQQKLAAFSDVAKSQDLMARATLSAADMSAAGFGTMETAATAMGKALSDPERNLGALTRMGVQFSKQQREQIVEMAKSGDKMEAQNLIMREVENTFGGVAAASASGTAKMKLAWDEAAESLGTTLVPILGILNAVLTKVANFAEEHSKAFLILASVFTGLAAAIVVANAAMKAWAVATKVAGVAVKVFGAILKSSLGVWGLIIAAVILVAVLIVKNWDKIKAWTAKVWGWVMGFLTRTWERIKSMASKVWDGIVSVVQRAWDIIKKVLSFTNPFLFVIVHLDKIKVLVAKAWDWIKNVISRAWSAIKGLFKSNPFAPIQGFLDSIKRWFSDAFDWILDKVRSVMDNVNSLVDNVQGAFNKAKDMADKIPRPGGRSIGGRGATATVVSRSLATEVGRQMVGGVPVPQAAVVPSRGGGGGVTITVNGALDPDAVGRQIKSLLERHDIRQGRTRGATRRVAW